MNFQRIDTFCEKFVAVLNEILVYGSNEWVESWNISISRQFHTATLRFAIPDFIPEIYEVVLPVDAFDDDQAMEKHLADSIQTLQNFWTDRKQLQELRLQEMRRTAAEKLARRKWWTFWK